MTTQHNIRVLMLRNWDEPPDLRGDHRHLPSGRAIAVDVGIGAYLLAMGYAERIGDGEPDENNLVDLFRQIVAAFRAARVEPTYGDTLAELQAMAAAEQAAGAVVTPPSPAPVDVAPDAAVAAQPVVAEQAPVADLVYERFDPDNPPPPPPKPTRNRSARA